jgi:hypothetical protein
MLHHYDSHIPHTTHHTTHHTTTSTTTHPSTHLHYSHTTGPIAAVHSPKFILPTSRSPAILSSQQSQSTSSSSICSSSISSNTPILPRSGVRTRSFVRQHHHQQQHQQYTTTNSASLPAPLILSTSSSSSNSSGRTSPHDNNGTQQQHPQQQQSQQQQSQDIRRYHTRSKSSSSPHGTSPHLISSSISTPRDAHQAHHHFHLSSAIPTIQLASHSTSHSPDSPIPDSIAARTRSQVTNVDDIITTPQHHVSKQTRSQQQQQQIHDSTSTSTTGTTDFGTNLTALFSTVHVHSPMQVDTSQVQTQVQTHTTPYGLRSQHKKNTPTTSTTTSATTTPIAGSTTISNDNNTTQNSSTEALYNMRNRG